MIHSYNEEQTDALQEIVNVGMGAAASSLAKTLGAFVQLPVPRVRMVRAEDFVRVISELTGPLSKLTAIRQAFASEFRGEAIVVFGANGAEVLAPHLGYTPPLSTSDVEEILLEIANILVGACLGGIAAQLSHELMFSAPSVIAHDVRIDEILGNKPLTWDRSLVVEVNFRLEDKSFVAHIFLFWPEASMEALARAIDAVLEAP